jgi:CCR4-NOT transcription complex subunit 9
MHMQVATFIVQKILLDDVGLRYICATAERFFAVGSVLANMVVSLADQPSTRLLKHIIRCYLRLSDNPRFVLSFVLFYTFLQTMWFF